MKKLLVLDARFHQRTKSFDFFLTLLRQRFDVTLLYYEEPGKTGLTRNICVDYDAIIYCEFLPSRFRLLYAEKPCLYVPMYDNEWGSFFLWKRIALSKMSILSFSETITKQARQCGVVNVLPVRFFPDSRRYHDMAGDPRIVLLWERGAVSFSLVKKLFRPEDVKEIIILRRHEENRGYTPLTEEDKKCWKLRVVETGFVDEATYLEQLRPAGTILAPRFKEGIGMVFLEAMAMGKVVVAHNDATMNEYIRHGENGILFDATAPHILDMNLICAIHKHSSDEILRLREGWNSCQDTVLNFIEQMPPCIPSLFSRVVSICLFPMFIFEWVIFRLIKRSHC